MTTAAFQATYSDWRLIKGRKCVQVVFEVPVEKADEAYQVLGGMPDPSESVWCAIARMNSGETEEAQARSTQEIGRPGPQSSGGRATPDKRLVQQAAMCCADPLFRKFLDRKYAGGIETEDDARDFVRGWCNVTSRAFIVPGTIAAIRWDELYSTFLAWKLAA
jgi:hypothetical protein